ncbi:MAG: exopolysaccharide biosynthesis polyprenyl glycosylphosphotransferase [Clostridia bacterium]|nr:exopolysaccharide biosynthesis polyprenyl glycosylphosphotransferase [Clostridia bacterium]
MRILKIIHFSGSVALFVTCWMMFYHLSSSTDVQIRFSILMCGFYAVVLAFLFRVFHAYTVGLCRKVEIVYSLSLSELLAAGIIYVLSCLAWLRFVNPLPLLSLLPMQVLFNIIWTAIANRVFFAMNRAKKSVVIYRVEKDLRRIAEVKKHAKRFEIVKYIEASGGDIGNLLGQIGKPEAIFVVGVPSTVCNALTKYCVDNGIEGYFAPHIGDIIMMGSKSIPQFHVPIVSVERKHIMPEYLFLKRFFDLILSAIGIVVLSPVLLICALAVKIYDGGPVIYKQTRLTKDGKTFKLLKFRSMRTDAEKDGVARLSSGDKDDRITPVGRILRKVRLDETPQLFNIFAGQMSIVGPRPERPEIAKQYEELTPAFSLRLQVKAGLTGYAQIYGKYNSQPYDKLEMDLLYINNMSFFEDLKLIFATVKILFISESTEGVESGQTTAMDSDNGTESKEKEPETVK